MGEPRGVARREVGQPALDRARLFLRRELFRDADPGGVELDQPPGHRREHGRPVRARVVDPLPEQAAPGLLHHHELSPRKVSERLRDREARRPVEPVPAKRVHHFVYLFPAFVVSPGTDQASFERQPSPLVLEGEVVLKDQPVVVRLEDADAAFLHFGRHTRGHREMAGEQAPHETGIRGWHRRNVPAVLHL